jgi:hypothetical protein
MARKLITHLGDSSPFENDGYFIFQDENGDYEAEYVSVHGEDTWVVFRFPLDRCTYVDGILSDNSFHPSHAVWFADSLDRIASCIGVEHHSLVKMLCSEDYRERLMGWGAVGGYHGFINLDNSPITDFDRSQLEKRYEGWEQLEQHTPPRIRGRHI